MVNRTPKRLAKQAEQQQPEFNDYFEAMKTGESVKAAPVSEGPAINEQLDALMKRVEALSAQNDALQSRYATPPIQITQAPPQQQAPQQEVIPDPVLDAAGYADWVLRRADALAQARINSVVEAQQHQAASSNAADDLWAGFLAIDGNEAWEDKPEMVEVAVRKVSKKLASKGIDPQIYMFQSTDKFYADVSKTLEADFGKPKVEEEENDEGETDRTAGLMGGQPSPVVAAPKDKAGGPPDLLNDLTAIQRKGGWY